jgi:hypothetical protein
MSVIPALGRLRQEDYEFEDNLDHIASSSLPELHRETLSQQTNKQTKTKRAVRVRYYIVRTNKFLNGIAGTYTYLSYGNKFSNFEKVKVSI